VKFPWNHRQPPWSGPSSSDRELANNEMHLTSAAQATGARR
jgi:hypothetical protein